STPFIFQAKAIDMAGSNAAERMTVPPDLGGIRGAISEGALRAGVGAIAELKAGLAAVERKLALAKTRAIHWGGGGRQDKAPRPFAESMMEQFPLDSAQGRAMMSLAEALLRTPDPARVDQLISERLAEVRGGGARLEALVGGKGAAGAEAPATADR